MNGKRDFIWIYSLVFSLLGLSSQAQDYKVYTDLQEALQTPLDVRHLELRKDDLTSIPSSVWQFKNLVILDLGKNELQTIPDSIAQLEYLKVLNLEKNDFTSFPASLCKLTHLEELFLADNRIEYLPEAIVGLEQLRVLDLYHTDLLSLPSSMNQMKNLIRLDLRQSYLSEQDYYRNYPENWLPRTEVQLTYGCDCGKKGH